MTWAHILMEIGSYGLAMTFGAYVWALLDRWWQSRPKPWDDGMTDEDFLQ